VVRQLAVQRRHVTQKRVLNFRHHKTIRDNPLAIGAVAAGDAVGFALPSTTFEKEYIGETSGTLGNKAEKVARDAVDKVQNAAQQITGE
jgi:hypothetical protein